VRDDAKLLLKLLDEHGPKLDALLTRLTLRSDLAEDLLQDLFLKLRELPTPLARTGCSSVLCWPQHCWVRCGLLSIALFGKGCIAVAS
jgi:DNA-directed RNA polymerase specialized sigma24 family protein